MKPSGGAGSCVNPKNCVAQHSFDADVDGRVKRLRSGGWLQLMEMRAVSPTHNSDREQLFGSDRELSVGPQMFSTRGLVWSVRSPLPLCEGRFPIGENDWTYLADNKTIVGVFRNHAPAGTVTI